MFDRFYLLLKLGFEVLWIKTTSLTVEEIKERHRKLFHQAADLSMLKLFESFLESAPQLLLQLCILTGHQEISIAQCKLGLSHISCIFVKIYTDFQTVFSSFAFRFFDSILLFEHRLGPCGLSALPAQSPPRRQRDAVRRPHSSLPPLQTRYHHQPHPQLLPLPDTEHLQRNSAHRHLVAGDGLGVLAPNQLLLVQRP